MIPYSPARETGLRQHGRTYGASKILVDMIELTCKHATSQRNTTTTFFSCRSDALILDQRATFHDIRPASGIVCFETTSEFDRQQRQFAISCSRPA